MIQPACPTGGNNVMLGHATGHSNSPEEKLQLEVIMLFSVIIVFKIWNQYDKILEIKQM